MSPLGISLIVVYSLDIIFVFFMVFLERKNPRSIIVWTLAIFLLPFAGLFAYLMCGRGPRFSKIRWTKQKKATDAYLGSRMKKGYITLYPGDGRVQKELIALNSFVSEAPCTTYNDITIFTDAKKMYEAQLKDISEAKKSINIIYYIFRTDEIGKKYVEQLTKKAKEGVQVNLMYDDSGNFKTRLFYFRELIKAGGIVQPFFPSLIKGINSNFNYRNHRKIVIIDGIIGYTGGMNIGKEYASMHKRITPWRDSHVRIVGEAVSLLQKRFLQDFTSFGGNAFKKRKKQFTTERALEEAYFPTPQPTDNVCPIQIITSGPDTSNTEIKFCYEKMISLAKKDVILETPYFIPDSSFIDHIILAQNSGIQVHLIIPGVWDKKIVYHVTLSWIENLLKAGVKVYLYNGFVHSKMVLVDDVAVSIGTANLDVRSFELNFEVNAIIYGSKEVKESRDILLNDIKNSKEITYEQYKKRSLRDRAAADFLRIFSELM